jgi:hypothetical protein
MELPFPASMPPSAPPSMTQASGPPSSGSMGPATSPLGPTTSPMGGAPQPAVGGTVPLPSMPPPASGAPGAFGPPGIDPAGAQGYARAPMYSLPPSFEAPANANAPHGGAPGAGAGAGPPRDGGAGQYAIAAIAGVLVAVVIGVGGYVVWARQRAEPAPLISAPTGAAGGAGAPASAAIEFQLTPPAAVITVDGIELAPGAKTIPRPAVGKSVMVVAHADGFDDATVLVDYFTTSPMVLSLAPAGPPPNIELGADADAGTAEAPGADGAGADAEPAASAAPSDEAPKPRPKPKPQQPALPSNPY